MPLKIGSLRSEIRPLVVPYNDDEVNLHYRPAVYTADYEAEVKALVKDERNAGLVARTLDEMLVDWDVEQDDGSPYELSIENLCTLHFDFTFALFEAITNDAKKANVANRAERRKKR